MWGFLRHGVRQPGFFRDIPETRNAVFCPFVQENPVARHDVVDGQNQIRQPVAIEITEGRAARPILRVEGFPREGFVQLSGFGVAAFPGGEKHPVRVACEEVRASITVHITHRQAETEEVIRQSGFRIGIFKFHPAEIPEQGASRLLGEKVFQHQQLKESVAIEIEDADVACRQQLRGTGTRFFRYLDQSPFVVAEEFRSGELGRALGFLLGAGFALGVVCDVEIHIAIIVEIRENRATGPRVELHGLLVPDLELQPAEVPQQHVRHRTFRWFVFPIRTIRKAADVEIGQTIAIHIAEGTAMPHDSLERTNESCLFGNVFKTDLRTAMKVCEQQEKSAELQHLNRYPRKR